MLGPPLDCEYKIGLLDPVWAASQHKSCVLVVSCLEDPATERAGENGGSDSNYIN